MLPHVDQLGKRLTKVMKQRAASETSAANENSMIGLEKDINSTMHFLLMPSHTGTTLGIVGNVGEGQGLEGWTRSVMEVEFDS